MAAISSLPLFVANLAPLSAFLSPLPPDSMLDFEPEPEPEPELEPESAAAAAAASAALGSETFAARPFFVRPDDIRWGSAIAVGGNATIFAARNQFE